MRKIVLAVIVATVLSGCGTISSASLSNGGPDFIGKTAGELFAEKGTPARQVTSPTGATIYVYEAHNLIGANFCEGSFYVRDGVVVGFVAQGQGITCGASAGNLQ
ncbi:MAG: hypothetical protein P4M13_06220 [Alphaproteobacteria bacterium]|nr:hypothetical protein [Alphaproteobacteria bacterium]